MKSILIREVPINAVVAALLQGLTVQLPSAKTLAKLDIQFLEKNLRLNYIIPKGTIIAALKRVQKCDEAKYFKKNWPSNNIQIPKVCADILNQ